jgi:hypothetical protein
MASKAVPEIAIFQPAGRKWITSSCKIILRDN